MRNTTIKSGVLAAVVLAASVFMGSQFKPRVKLRRHYTITNAAELAPVTTLISEYLASECVNVHTRRAYEIALGYFAEFAARECGRKPNTLSYSDLSRSLVTKFRDERLEVESPASAELRLRVVRSLCSWCAERFQVPNPALKIRSRYEPEMEFKGLSADDRAQLIAAAKQQSEPLRRFLPLFLLYTGMRNDEARNIKLAQIDDRREWINKVVGKSTRIRDIAITDELRHELSLYMCWRTELRCSPRDPLLPSTYRKQDSGCAPKPLCNKTIWRIVNESCTEAGTDNDVRHPHALRHTFAYTALDHLEHEGVKPGRALIILKDLMGHKSIQTTMRYLGNEKDEQYELLREMR